MFTLWHQNHTTGAGGYGPVSRHPELLRRHLEEMDYVEWSEGVPGLGTGRDPTEEEKTWEWYSGVTKGGRTTYTAFIRPLEILGEETLVAYVVRVRDSENDSIVGVFRSFSGASKGAEEEQKDWGREWSDWEQVNDQYWRSDDGNETRVTISKLEVKD